MLLPTVTGPDVLALQVRDLERAANVYERRLGRRRAPVSPPGAIVFASEPVAFAVRDPDGYAVTIHDAG